MFPLPLHSYFARCLLVLFSFLLLPVASPAAEPDVVAAAKTPPRLVCKPCSVNFGKVHIGQSKSLPVVLINSGDRPIRIASKVKRAAWVTPSGLDLPYTLAAGHQVRFNLVYKPMDKRTINGHIAYHSNAVNNVLPISMTGTASTASAGALTASPDHLDFGSATVGSTLTKNQTVTNTGTSAVTITQVSQSGAGFSISGVSTPLTLAPGHSFTFTTKFEPQSAGSVSGSVIVLSNASNYRLSVVETGSGLAGGSISLNPAALSFGNVTIGSKKSMTATISAAGSSKTITSVSLTSSEYSISGLTLPLTLAAGKSVSFSVGFAPKTGGTANASVSFAVKSRSTPLKASLSGNGTSGNSHSVTLSWNAPPSQVSGYNVYRSASATGSYAKLTSPLDPSTNYVDSSVAAGKTYYYEVSAVNTQGVESTRSKPVTAKVPSP